MLFIASILLILISLSGAYAQDTDTSTLQNNSSVEIPSQNSTSTNSGGEIKETVINGTVNDCKTKNPFPGVNITVSDNSKVIASALTKEDGSYYLYFLSNHTNFNVTASHFGHYSVTKEVILSSLNDSIQYGTVNFQLGTTLYVNGNTGNDGWDGTSPTHSGGSVGPKKTIKSAISASQNGGTISIGAGTYKGSDNRHLSINNLNLNIIGNGTTGAGNTTIDPEQNDLIFLIGSGSSSNVTIQNLTFTGGEAHGTVDGDDGDDGGAIYNEGKLTINNCLFINNHARNGDNANAGAGHAGHGGDGGAIYNKGTLTITNSNFENNHAGSGGNASDIHDGDYGGSGGAIFNYGTSTITNCSFKDNYAGKGGNANAAANAAPGGHGGAIFNNATLTITNCIFDSNYAGKGGDSSGLSDGKDGGDGGAIYNNGTLSTLQNSTFISNHAGNGGSTQTGSHYVGGNGGNGGAIYNYQKFKINIINCIFDSSYSGNGAEGSDIGNAKNGGNGGAIYNYGIMSISGGEIKNGYTGIGGQAHGAFNAGSGGSGGAIYNMGNLTISANCNIYNNTCGKGIDAATAGSTPGTGGYGGAIYSSGNLTISDSKIHDNRAGDSGGPSGSDTGKAGGNGGGIYNKNNLTIQNCEVYNNKAGTGGNGSDYFESSSKAGQGGYGGGICNEGQLTISQNSKIYGNSAGTGGNGHHSGEGGYGGGIYNNGTVNINGNSTNPINIYSNAGGAGGNPDSDDDGGNYGKGGRAGAIYNKGNFNVQYAIINNNNGGKGEFGGDGGAVYNDGTLTLNRCNITNNQALFNCKSGVPDGSGGNGGGIYNTAHLTITNCQITNNKAGDGPNGPDADWKKDEYYIAGGDGSPGGSGGGIYNTGTLTITGSSISNNSAGKGGNGGKGEACFRDDVNPPDPPSAGGSQVSTLDPGNGGNGGNGGGIFNNGTITSITNTTINFNTAGKGGDGGLYFDDISAFSDLYKVTPAIAGIGGSGGGIYSIGRLNSLQNTTINNNAAGNGGNGNPVSRYPSENGNAGGNGGGLVIFNSIEIINCQISNNKAGNGGNGGKTYIDSDNNPSTKPGTGGNAGSGGGIYVYYDNSKSAYTMTTTISSSTLDNNSAGTGGAGGIDDKDGSHSSNGGNGGNGGAVAIISAKIANPPNYSLHLYLEESTITNNKAGLGGQPYLTGTKGIDGVGGGLYSNDNHYFTVDFNRIVNNTPQAVYLSLSSTNSYTNFYNNWWGSNNAPISQIAGNHIDSSYYSPWIVLSINATPNSLYTNQVSNIVTNLIMNSNGDNTLLDLAMHVPDGIPVTFATSSGNLNPSSGFTSVGSSSTVFTANSVSGTAQVNATVDNQTLSVPIQILPSADVGVTKIVNNSRPNVGEPVTFTITARNYGPDNATNIQIIDKISTGFKNVVINTSAGTYNSTNGIWTIPQLNNGTSAFLTITGIINETIAGITTTNTAIKTREDQVDPNSNNDQASASIYVPLIDIQVIKIVNKQTVNVGQTSTFTITAKNNGPDNATNIQIIDQIPPGFSNATISFSMGTYNNTTNIWTIPQLNNGVIATLNITGTVTGDLAGKTTTNIANKTYTDQYDSNPNNDKSNASIYVPLADIHIAKTVDKNKPNVGDPVTFTVTVINDGPDNATNIQIQDLMPAGFDNINITPSMGTYNNTTGIWTIPQLNNGENATLTLTGTINSTIASQTITNTANLTNTDQYDPTPNNTASASINIPEADIDITKTANKNIANIGEDVIFTIIITNKGPDTATGLIFIDKLPVGLKFNSAIADKYISLNQSGNYILWNLGSLDNAQTATLRVNTTIIEPGILNNIVRKISEDQYDPDIDFANATVYAPQADISITKTVNKAIANVGENVTFTVTARNNGPDNATNIQIQDLMPTGFSNIQITPSTGTYNNNNGIWTIPQLNNGENATLTLSGILTSNITSQVLMNTANKTYQDQFDPNPNNDNSSASIYVLVADIHITKTVDKNRPNVGDIVTFTVTVINDGPDKATNIQIQDLMPTGFNNITITPSTGTYNNNNGIWTIPQLNNGENATLTLTGTINSTIASQTITNTANLTNTDQYDPTPNNTASASINIPEADIDITKTANKNIANIGEDVIFTITITNHGPDQATGIQIMDKLPQGLKYNSAFADKGNLSTGFNYVYWDLGTLNNGELAVLVVNTTVIEPELIINIVRKIHEDQYDPDIDFASAVVYTLEADVSITNKANQAKLNVGETAIFTVTARNDGPNKATNVVINDLIPSGFTANVNKGEIVNGVWNIGTLERNEEAILTLTGIITSDWAGKTIYNNISEKQNEYNSNPQTASANIYVPLAEVSINKVARNIHFNRNDTVRFIIVLENDGPDVATGIKILDMLPYDLEFVSASDYGIFDPVSRTITWNLNNLTSGLYHAFILETKVKASISNDVITNAVTESQNEYNPGFKSSNATITINKADLYLTNTVNKSNIHVGDKFTVTFKLGNNGPDIANNVIVKIPIPEGLEFINASVDLGIWNYDNLTRTLIWTVGDVKVGDPYLYLTLKSMKSGQYTIYPIVTTTTYDPNLESSAITLNTTILPVHIDVKPADNNDSDKNDSGKVPMHKTGIPLAILALAIFMVLGGLFGVKRK